MISREFEFSEQTFAQIFNFVKQLFAKTKKIFISPSSFCSENVYTQQGCRLVEWAHIIFVFVNVYIANCFVEYFNTVQYVNLEI